ncbi:hypothetical protein [Rhizobium sp. PL01]|uniref:hypothetical protein n=1 Tax=Rhizobium sp. PL01 TaxID=3085631 RepID=UPI002981720C|nr:hypothetical protein [Rhizobium sp. PL01]MDW5313001.1 hypothetical protein [Rhizobium sp. PL01]
MLAIIAAQGASGCASRVNESNFNSVLAQLFARYRSERQPEHASLLAAARALNRVQPL